MTRRAVPLGLLLFHMAVAPCALAEETAVPVDEVGEAPVRDTMFKHEQIGSAPGSHIFDEARLFTASERDQLSARLKEFAVRSWITPSCSSVAMRRSSRFEASIARPSNSSLAS